MASGEIRVGFESALSFWRKVRAANLDRMEDIIATEGHVFGARELTLAERVSRALTCCGSKTPLDVVVTSPTERHRSTSIRDHVWSGVVGKGELLPMGGDVSFFQMPAVFVQLGMTMDDIELAQVACEMMGTYGLTPWADKDRIQDISPLVTLADLQNYATAARIAGVRGATTACNALALCAENSNSPRETDVCIFMKTTRLKGGAELRGFVMNEPIEVPEKLRSLAGQGKIVPDFCWSEQKVVQEYDSDEDHLDPVAKTRDERRRKTLEAMGYRVFVLTNGILRSNVALNGYLKELEKQLGLRRRPLTSRQLDRRRDLRKLLFGSELTCEALKELNQKK